MNSWRLTPLVGVRTSIAIEIFGTGGSWFDFSCSPCTFGSEANSNPVARISDTGMIIFRCRNRAAIRFFKTHLPLMRCGADAHAVEGAVDKEEGDGEEGGRENVR